MVENPIHASIVLNIHREAVFLRRTLLSLSEAGAFARSKGIYLELIAVLDRTDDETRQVLSSSDLSIYEKIKIIEVDNGSLGPSRNDGINQSSGEYIFTADADDLVSYNYFHDILIEAHKKGNNALYFPEQVFCFGGEYSIIAYKGLEVIPPQTFVDRQPYISRLCAHRDIFLSIPYADVRLQRGYAYEDWHFNAEAVAFGVDIHTVPGTILFYRQRPDSLLKAADAISIRQIPPTRLFEPTVYLKLSESHEQRGRVEGENVRSERPERLRIRLTEHPQTKDFIARANAIEPSISAERYKTCRVYENFTGPYPLGAAYRDLCDIVRDRDFSDVFLLPFMSRGGAEKYFLHLMEALYELDPFKDFLVVLGEDLDNARWTGRLPPNAVVVDMAVHCRALSLDERCVLTLKLIETCSSETRIHMRQSIFVDRFLGLYGVVLKDRESVYYRFSDIERIKDGQSSIVASPLGLISDNLDYLSKIVCDSMTTIEKDHHRLGLQTHKWHCLHAPVEAPAVLPSRENNAARRVLWASRLDTEKRPSLLPLIASRLSRSAPDAHIDVFGGSVFNGFDPFILERLRNLQYHGPYNGFGTLPLSRFSIFLYTSLHDGIPNVILEAMSHGLTVIAPNVGSISEVVIDGETGILLPSLADDRDMASSYMQAIQGLLDDPGLARELAEKGRAHVRRVHSPDVHMKRVAELFGIQQRHLQYA
ncbi:glycosyltransferase [Microvirga sp. VF16]|uniref:glycosyltransferase n=1 Tax=Microvirga sp. VF16 TaxID=2807101 RepID=UPI00193E2C5F|nr:glycosyltransferase [Microvirga sp. VF16]QRM29669.1 glycosyltransferase [Microvirga sp. VF16]